MRIDAGLRRRRPRFSRQWSSGAPPAGSSIGTRSPPLSLGAAQKPHKRCTTSCLLPTLSYAFQHPPHRSPGPPASSGVRACGAAAHLILGSKAEPDLQCVQRTDRCAWVDRRLIHTPPRSRLVRGPANLRMSECHNPVTRRARPTPAGPSGDNEPWRALGPWSDASRVCQPHKLTRCRFRRADRGAAEPRTQKCQSPPVKVGHAHPGRCRGNALSCKSSFPHIVPVSQPLKLATGVFVPATDRCGLGAAKEHPSHVPSETAWKARFARLGTPAGKTDAPYRSLSRQRVMVAL